MNINSREKPLVLKSEEGAEFRVAPTNRGEPFRTGISVELTEDRNWVGLFLEDGEAKQLHAFLTGYLKTREN